MIDRNKGHTIKQLMNTVTLGKKIRHIISHERSISLKTKEDPEGNVLLSYITSPFFSFQYSNLALTHSNQWECHFIADYWLDKGYHVDVINWDDTKFVPRKKYDILIDIHSNMERLSPLLGSNCLKILHATGAHWLFQNSAEFERLLALKERRGIVLKPRRQVEPSRAIEIADAVTFLGNEFTRNTYEYAKKPLFPLPLPTIFECQWNQEKDFTSCRRNYLWMGSSGMVHKGLDLVLEAFSMMPEYNLTICGPVENEEDFVDCYSKELFKTPNIHTIGWVDVRSRQFKEIIDRCIGLVYPSCSEGQAGSVVTCLHAGLIPLISYQSGVDINSSGILFQDSTIEKIQQGVQKISALPVQTLAEISRNTWEFAKARYTRHNYAQQYHSHIQQIIRNSGII